MNHETKKIIRDNRYGFLILILLLCSSLVGGHLVSEVVEERIDLEFRDINFRIIQDLETSLREYENILVGVKALYSSSSFVSREEFSQFIDSQKIFDKHPEIYSIQYVEKVKASDLEYFINDQKREGYNLDIVGKGDFDNYLLVNYVEPDSVFQANYGYNLSSDPEYVELLNQATDINEFVISKPISLDFYSLKTSAFVGVLPIYHGDKYELNLIDRREMIEGFLIITLKVDDLIEGVLENHPDSEKINIYINDQDVQFISRVKEFYSEVDSFYLSERLKVGNREWDYVAYSTDGFIENYKIEKIFPLLIILFGSVFGILIFVIFYIISRANRANIDLAIEMTENFNVEKEKAINQAKELEKEKKITLDKLKETERLNNLMVNREIKIKELKDKIKELENKK